MRKYLLLLPFFLSFFMINNSYAVSDITVHIDSTTSGWTDLCIYYGSVHCDDYNYYLVEFHDFELNTSSNSVAQDIGAFNTILYSGIQSSTSFTYAWRCNPLYSSYCLMELSSIGYPNTYGVQVNKATNFDSYYQSGWSIDLTLSENNPFETECPEPEDPEPCPAVPETPYADKFDNIEKAIYVCGAILIMLYFFYCIYRMIIKGSGVN